MSDSFGQTLLYRRQRLFWLLQVGGWSGYALAAYLGSLAYEKPDAYFWVILATAATGFIFTIVLRLCYRRFWDGPPLRLAIAMVVLSFLFTLPWKAFSNYVYWHWVKGHYRPAHLWEYAEGSIGAFYVLLCWSGLYAGIKYYLELQRQTERTLKAQAAAHQAQLKMLRYQLNPHFLFNTLNAISTLILDARNDLANQAVSRLSRFLRYTLDSDPMKKVPLGKELEALHLYLSIEQVRFDERLRLSYAIEDAARNALVPSLILQPLVENAIKYAVAPRESGGAIRIEGKITGKTLHLVMADDGPGLSALPTENGRKGVGLTNTRERLAQLYADAHRFELSDNEPSGLLIRMDIPYERDDTDPHS